MSQVWVLYHMDLRCILVAMFFYLSHASSLYWSATMVRRHLVMSQKYWCIADAWLMMISDQANSCLEVITCSFKSLTYHIPLDSCFGGHYFIPKSHHRHVQRTQTSMISLNTKLWSENTGPDFNLAYKNPAPLMPLRKGALPSSVIPTISWQWVVPLLFPLVQAMVLPCHHSVIVEEKQCPW